MEEDEEGGRGEWEVEEEEEGIWRTRRRKKNLLLAG